MKKINLIFVFVLFVQLGFSQIPNGYYDGTEGLTGDALRMKLRDIITSGHTSNSYDALYDYYEQTDNYGDNKVWDMYSIHADGTADYWFYFNSGDECGTYSGEGDCYNREHSVPQSWFGSAQPMVADLFIVVPTDGYVNNRRSNYPYGENDGEDFISTNGSKLGSCTYPGYSGTVFEPIDEYKGDFARAYFYVVTRYDVSSWDGASFSGDGLSTWTKNMLLEWNDLDPVSQKEIDRNNAVYNIQHNRNPYIDHPEWVCLVFGSNCSGLMFVSSPVTNATAGNQYTYNIRFKSDEGTNPVLSATTLPSWLNLSQTSDSTGILTGTPSNSDIGDNDVVLSLTDGENTVVQNFTITVAPHGQVVLIDEDFSSCPPANWTTYSVASDKNWECSDYGYMYINAYNGDVAADDWLISPALDLSSVESPVLTFATWTRYADDGITDPEVRLKYSTDYPGSGNPENYTWTELSYTYPAEDSQNWTASGDIDLSSIQASNVYIAFQYTSSGTGANSSAIWEVDNVSLIAYNPASVDEVSSNVKIYPNPSTDGTITISTDLQNVSVMLYSAEGRFINSYDLHNDKKTILVNNGQKGLYLLQIKSENSIFWRKIIIK